MRREKIGAELPNVGLRGRKVFCTSRCHKFKFGVASIVLELRVLHKINLMAFVLGAGSATSCFSGQESGE